MNNYCVYEKAIKELYHLTYGKFEHDEIKAIELFDKLIDRGTKIHPDELKRLCKDVGYSEAAREEISQIYDIVKYYKEYLNKPDKNQHWTSKMIDRLYIGENNE